jgi:hypothetical protein
MAWIVQSACRMAGWHLHAGLDECFARVQGVLQFSVLSVLHGPLALGMRARAGLAPRAYSGTVTGTIRTAPQLAKPKNRTAAAGSFTQQGWASPRRWRPAWQPTGCCALRRRQTSSRPPRRRIGGPAKHACARQRSPLFGSLPFVLHASAGLRVPGGLLPVPSRSTAITMPTHYWPLVPVIPFLRLSSMGQRAVRRRPVQRSPQGSPPGGTRPRPTPPLR